MSVDMRSVGVLVFEYNNFELNDKGEACFICATKMAMKYTPKQISITIINTQRHTPVCDICDHYID